MRWVRYQQRYLADRAPQKVVLKARRIGYSEAIAFERACRGLGVLILPGETPKMVPAVPQNLVSASQRQSIVLLEKVLKHVKALGHGMVGSPIQSESKTFVRLTNGKHLQAFSSNPHSIRGDGGDIFWDEAALTARDREVWSALRPLANPTLGHREGYHTVICSTPFGDSNLFYEFCRGELAKAYSRHEVDWRQAVADGFPFDEAEERKEYPDPEIFAQEFELSFLSAEMRYISEAVWDAATYDYERDRPRALGTWYGGMDVARHRDNSAIVTGQMIGDTLFHMTTEARRDVEWSEQEAWVKDEISPDTRQHMHRFCVDSTGLGDQFAERLTSLYPGVVEGIDFTAQNKDTLASGLKLALQRKRFRPRVDDVDLRRDVLNLRRIVTATNNVRYDAPRDKSGHADRAWAATLCVHAADTMAKSSVTTRGGTTSKRERPVERSSRRATRRDLGL